MPCSYVQSTVEPLAWSGIKTKKLSQGEPLRSSFLNPWTWTLMWCIFFNLLSFYNVHVLTKHVHLYINSSPYLLVERLKLTDDVDDAAVSVASAIQGGQVGDCFLCQSVLQRHVINSSVYFSQIIINLFVKLLIHILQAGPSALKQYDENTMVNSFNVLFIYSFFTKPLLRNTFAVVLLIFCALCFLNQQLFYKVWTYST